MPRTMLLPLVSMGLLAMMLMPSIALGLAGDSVHRDAEPATSGATGTATSTRAEGLARPTGTDRTTATPAVSAGPAAVATPTVESNASDADASAQLSSVDRPDLRIRLACELVRADVAPVKDPLAATPDVAPAVACRWSEVDAARVRGYQVWRAVDAPDGVRRLIAAIPAGERLRYVDHKVSTGHAYTYVVIALAPDGSKIATGGPVTVRIPPRDETLKLACELASNGDQRGVACKWSEANHPAAAGYVLWRSVDGGAREKIHRTGLDGRRGFFDTDVKPGQTIRYAVVLVDKVGDRVGQGGPVTVRIPPRDETLKLACELASNGDQRGVACKWSEANHPAAAGYVLWRSVDGGAREKIHRTGLDGRRGFFDTDVKPGQTIRYAVVLVDKVGDRVGQGGPVTVRIPPRDETLKPQPTDVIDPTDAGAAVGSRG